MLFVPTTAPPDINPDPAFPIPSAGTTTNENFVQFSATTLVDVPADDTGRVRLGSLRFQTAAPFSGSTSLTASDIPDQDDWFRFDSSQPLGSQFVQFDNLVQSYQIFVTPVPEPATAGLVAVAFFLVRRRFS